MVARVSSTRGASQPFVPTSTGLDSCKQGVLAAAMSQLKRNVDLENNISTACSFTCMSRCCTNGTDDGLAARFLAGSHGKRLFLCLAVAPAARLASVSGIDPLSQLRACTY